METRHHAGGEAAVGWSSGVFGAIGQVVGGFVSGVALFFSSIWIGNTTGYLLTL